MRVTDPKTGKSKPTWVSGFDTRESAELARDEARLAKRKRLYVPPTSRTVGEFLTTWLHEIHRPQLKINTYDSYEKLIRNYLVPGIGSIRLCDLKPSDIQRFYTDTLSKPGVTGKPINPRTVQYAGAILKKSLKYAVEVEGVLPFNPATRVPLVRTNPKRFEVWTRTELDTFLEVAKPHRLSFFFRLSAYTGARRGELLALRWADLEGKYINISKSRVALSKGVSESNTTKGGNGGKRRVKLDDATLELFEIHRKLQKDELDKLNLIGHKTNYVFTREDGLPVTPDHVTHLFRKLTVKAGLRVIRLHDLRHLHATELLRLGEPLHVVANRLGHKDAMVTATIYAHVTDEQAESASDTFAKGVRLAN
jgi:integrase